MADWYDKIIDEVNKERKTVAFYETKGFGKLWQYLRAIVESDEFQKRILGLRERYRIPKEGFETPADRPWTHPIETWEFSGKHPEQRALMSEIRVITKNLCREYSLLPRDWAGVFEDYLFYNRLFLNLEPSARNLCFVADATTNRDGVGHEIDDDDRRAFPVVLHINPYASERDVIDYVKKVFKPEIESVQNAHKKADVKIGKFRKRKESVRKRNALLYKNRHSSNKQAAKLAREQHPDAPIKASSVGKTIEREKKRRGISVLQKRS
jgi:hypothetical protein